MAHALCRLYQVVHQLLLCPGNMSFQCYAAVQKRLWLRRPGWDKLDISGWTSDQMFSGVVHIFSDIDHGISSGDENYAESTTHVFAIFDVIFITTTTFIVD